MDDREFQNTVFPLLAKDIFKTNNSQKKE